MWHNLSGWCLNAMSFSLGGQCLHAMWHTLGGQCLNATWPNLGGQCLNATWLSLGGQCLNATWHLTNQNYVWPINQGLNSYLNDHHMKPPIKPLIIHLLHGHPKKPKFFFEPNHPITYFAGSYPIGDEPLL